MGHICDPISALFGFRTFGFWLYLFDIAWNGAQVMNNVFQKLNCVGHERDLASCATVKTVQRFADNLWTMSVDVIRHNSTKILGNEESAWTLENVDPPENVKIQTCEKKYKFSNYSWTAD